MIHHISRMKNKNHVIISIDTEKVWSPDRYVSNKEEVPGGGEQLFGQTVNHRETAGTISYSRIHHSACSPSSMTISYIPYLHTVPPAPPYKTSLQLPPLHRHPLLRHAACCILPVYLHSFSNKSTFFFNL